MTPLALAACTVDLERGRVHHVDGERALTPREVELLRYLVDRAGVAVSRDELHREVFRYGPSVVSRGCDSAIRRLREKLEADPARPDHLLTAFGEGYRFVPTRPQPQAPSETGASWAARVVDLGDVRVDLDRARVSGATGEHELTGNEVALLGLLAEREAVDSDSLALRVWGSTHGRPLISAVARLRKKLERDPGHPERLVTTATGYALRTAAPATPAPPPEELLGRAALVDEVAAAVRPGRWVVLTGLGGIGKTSVARRVAASGGCWVDVAGAVTGDALAFRLARAWRIPQPTDEDPVERLAAVLAHKTGLVVLDDLDLVDASGKHAIARWVAEAPQVRWLGTSRTRTRIAGERVIEVPALPTDDAERLFVARARSADPAFRLRPADRAAVRALVDRVDGHPLAIGLLASRAALWSPPELLGQLERRPSLDWAVDPSAPGPHASMRDVIGASVTALSEVDRTALFSLATLRSFDAADALALAGPLALERVATLRDRSLIRPSDLAGPRRFAAWEVVREYVAESQTPAQRLRVLEHLSRFGDEGARRGLEDQDPAVFDAVDAALDDLWAAVDAATEVRRPDLAALCVIPLAHRFLVGGPYLRGVELLRATLDQPGVPERIRARLQMLLASTEYELRRFADAARTAADARDAAVRADDRRTELSCEIVLADCNRIGDLDLPAAVAHWARAEALASSLDDPTRETWAQACRFESEGDKVQMQRCLERLVAETAPGHPLVMCALQRLGTRTLAQNRLSEARSWLGQASDHPLARRYFAEWLNVQQQVVTLHLASGDTAALDAAVGSTLTAIADLGLALDEAILKTQHGASLLYRGEAGAAAQRMESARASLARAPRSPAVWSYFEGRLGEVLLTCGDPVGALVLFDRALGFVRAANRPNSIAQLESLRACALAATGRLAEAIALAEAARESILDHPARVRALVSARLSALHARGGDLGRARILRDEAWQLGRDAGGTELPTEVGWALRELERTSENWVG